MILTAIIRKMQWCLLISDKIDCKTNKMFLEVKRGIL